MQHRQLLAVVMRPSDRSVSQERGVSCCCITQCQSTLCAAAGKFCLIVRVRTVCPMFSYSHVNGGLTNALWVNSLQVCIHVTGAQMLGS